MSSSIAKSLFAGLFAVLVFPHFAGCQTKFLEPRLVLSSSRNFCPNGVYRSSWPEGKPAGIRVWGSFCNQGDGNTGAAESSSFPAPAGLSLYLSGYPSDAGLSLELQNLGAGTKLTIKPHENPRERWRRFDFSIPRSWRGKPVRLIAKDNATGPGGWLAFSEPFEVGSGVSIREAAILLLRTASHWVLIMIPCFAACGLAAWKGVRDVVILGLTGLASTAVSGYLAFWLWFFSPRVGHAVSFLLPIFAIACLLWVWRKLDASGRAALRNLLVPAALVFAAALLVLSAGFLYGGMNRPLSTPWTRFSHALPPDNTMPFVLAEQIRSGHILKPFFGDWLSSDRPPLETGIVLSQYPFLPQPGDLGYTTLGVVLQSLWIFALWLFLSAFDLNRRAIALTLAVTLFSGFVFITSFFVWPKLLAAAYMLAFSTIFLSERIRERLRRDVFLAVLAGALLAFGLLSHGASVFALMGMIVLGFLLRMKLPVKKLAIVVSAGLVLYLPWMLYQKFFDPPGDRLLKYHLAGVEHVDARPFVTALTTGYRELGFRRLIENREASANVLFGDVTEYWERMGHFVGSMGKHESGEEATGVIATRLRGLAFFFLFPNLGFLIAGLIALPAGIGKRFRCPTWRVAALIWCYIICGLIPFWVLIFEPAGTSIHVGTYVTVLLAYAGSVLALWAVAPWLALLIGLLQMGLNFILYGVYMREPSPNGLLQEGVMHSGNLAVLVFSFVAVFLLLTRLPVKSN